ncbi:MAG: hypothetical protein EOO77_16925 [Oxalobacteraceae bacterium]|nr:MAG: hypothetical protein EOO77_16925 [Oxalobacteraceae bacterium]
MWEVADPVRGGTVDILALAVSVYPYDVHLRRVLHTRTWILPMDEALAWCLEHFGEESRKTAHGFNLHCWVHFGARFLFKNPDHAFEFKVRWG